MIRKIIITSLILTSFSSFAEFKQNDWSDEMNDITVVERYSYNNSYSGSKFGFRCDTKVDEKDFMLTFKSHDTVATPNSVVDLKIRVDKGSVHSIKGRMYNNSYDSGLSRDFTDELLSEIRNGDKLLLNIYSHNRLEAKLNFSLKGSAKALHETYGACNDEPQYSSEVMAKIKSLENERDRKISQIKSDYELQIAEVKGH